MAEKKLTRKELEAKALKFVCNAYKSFSNRSGLEAKWKKFDAQYNLESEEDKDSRTLSKLFPPETRRALQTIADFIIDVLFPPTSDWFRIKGVDGDADVKNAEVYKKIADVQHEKMMIRAKVTKSVHRWLKYGFMLARATQVYKDKYIIAEEKARRTFKDSLKSFFTGAKGLWSPDMVPKKQRMIVYDNTDFEVLSPWNTYWNYRVPWEQQKIVIQKIDDVTASHLKAQKGKIYNDNVDDVIEAMREQVATGQKETSSDNLTHLDTITGLSGDFNDGIPRCRLLQADCYFDIDQDGYDELCIITVAITVENNKPKVDENGDMIGTVIRMSLGNDLQEMPVLFCQWDELEDMSLGMGVMQIAEKDQASLNTFTNQCMDGITKILCATKLYDEEMIAEGQNLNTWYNKAIKTKGNPSEVIAYDRPPNIITEALAAITMAKGNIQNGTRANISLQGLAARYDTTATEYTQQGNAASRGIMVQLKNFEENVIKKYLRIEYSYNEGLMTRDTLIAILGKTAANAMLRSEDGMEIKDPKEIIMGDYDFIPLGVTQTENKVIRGQQLINYLGVALKVEAVKPGTHDLAFLSSKIWETIGDGDNRVLLPQITDPAMDPNDENVLLSQGAQVVVNPLDNDDEHIQTHIALQLIPDFEKNRLAHLKMHMMAKQQKMMQMQAKVPGQVGNPQGPTFKPKLPMPGNNGNVPGVQRPPVM